MDNIEVSNAPAAPIATPAAAPVTATPAPTYTAPTTSDGGGGGDSFTDILKGLNWVEIGISLLGVTALVYTISYFRYNFKIVKPEMANMQNQIDDLTIKVSQLTDKENKVSADGVNTQGFYI